MQWMGSLPNRVELAKQLSPLSMIRADSPPILTIHGDADPIVPYDHAVRLHAALDRAGVANQLHTIKGGSHGGFTVDQTIEAYRVIRDFLASSRARAEQLAIELFSRTRCASFSNRCETDRSASPRPPRCSRRACSSTRRPRRRSRASSSSACPVPSRATSSSSSPTTIATTRWASWVTPSSRRRTSTRWRARASTSATRWWPPRCARRAAPRSSPGSTPIAITWSTTTTRCRPSWCSFRSTSRRPGIRPRSSASGTWDATATSRSVASTTG